MRAETIERYLLDSQARVEHRATISTWLPVLTERLAPDRLRGLARLETGTLEVPAVLFLCVHNAGLSQMAAGFLRHLAGDTVEVFSGGSDPGVDVNPVAVRAMAEVGIDIATEYPSRGPARSRALRTSSSRWAAATSARSPGQRYEDWKLADPAGQPIEVVREIRAAIEAGVMNLMTAPGSTSAD